MQSRLVHPRYWGVWLVLGLYRAIVLLPHPVLMALGRHLGRFAMRVLRSRVTIARKNIDACFPEISEAERRSLLTAHFESLGMGLLEAGMAWWWDREKLLALAEIRGFHHLEQAAAKGKGVLLFGAHFTSMEIGGSILAYKFPLDVMYRHSNNAAVEYVMSNARRRVCRHLIERAEVKELLRSLRQGRAVWYAPDQNTQRKKAVFADFFGHKAATTPATARLAQITGAAVVPFRTVRTTGGKRYRLEIEAELMDFPSGDVVRDTQRTNGIIERWARDRPEQYLWIHRRFRTRPDPTDSSFY